MHPLLESAWLKANRANAHLEDLKKRVEAFVQRQGHFIATYLDMKTGEKIYRVERMLEEPPTELSPIIGDALFDYRSALDHLMWALVIQSGSTPQERRTQWPIFETDEAFFDERRGGRMWRGVTPAIQAALEREQPYDPRNAGAELIRYLDRLHQVDKHRHFNLVVWAYAGTFARTNDIRVLRNAAEFVKQHVGRVEKGTILARIPRDYVNMDFLHAFDVAFGEGTPAAGEKVLLILGGIDDHVSNILIDFEERLFS